MVKHHHNTEWLIELLSHYRIIPLYDGLGTLIHRITSKDHTMVSPKKHRWTIGGRDDVIALMLQRTYDDLSSALVMAKSLKRKFLSNQKRKK